MKRLLLIVLFISVGLSQQEWNMKFIEEYGGVTYAPNSKKPYTGKVYSFYESGETKEEGKYRNGLKDGKWTHFRYGGQKDREEIYKDGKEIEKSSWTYYENGQKKSEETYKDGKRDGLWTGWYENGQKKAEGTRKDGNKDGLWTHYTDVGNGKYEVTYKAGIYTVAVFTDNLGTNYKGSPIITDFIGQDGTYLSGNKIGDKYDFSKFPWAVATLKDWKVDGLWTTWYENGQKKSEETYKDGKRDGLWTGWYENGQKNSERTWKDREQISSICWDEDGNECECHEYGNCDKEDDDWGNEDW